MWYSQKMQASVPIVILSYENCGAERRVTGVSLSRCDLHIRKYRALSRGGSSNRRDINNVHCEPVMRDGQIRARWKQ